MNATDDRRLAAACMLGSFAGTVAPPWMLRAVRDGLGGVLLFAQNVVDDAQVADVCEQLRDARADVVIAIDEEGGDVTRLDAARGSDTPSPAAFGYVDDARLTAAAYAALGLRVRSAGIDLTLAPCADINSNPCNPIIGVRSFGVTAERVSRHVVAAIEGFHAGGISVCAKHFPGHGDTSTDTHLGPARVSASVATLTERELRPFAAAIDAGADAILTAHLVADAFDAVPASMSALWTEHLRTVVGFGGTIITDALDMDAVAEGRGIAGVAAAAVRALRAGADFLCLGSNFDDAMTAAVIERVAFALGDAEIKRDWLERSCERIALLRRPPPTRTESHARVDSAAAQLVAERAIVIDGELPAGPFFVVECRPPGNVACFNVAWGIADALRGVGWPTATITASDPIASASAAVLEMAGEMPILVVVRDTCVHPWQSAVIDVLVASACPRSVVVVELGWPSDRRSGIAASVLTHGAARSSAQAVVDHLGPRRASSLVGES